MSNPDLTSRGIPAEPSESDDPRAPYVSPARSNQARATRRSIVAAAAELFVAQGYAATTIGAVAERAGVGRKTVFDSVGGKGALLKLAWDWALAGDDEPVAMTDRPRVQAMLAERDPQRLVGMWVDMLIDVGVRAAPLGQVVLAAADVDADAAALRDLIRSESHVGATAFVTHLASVGGLRPDLTVERGADACWALLNSLLLPLLTSGRGWSVGDYGDWLVRVVSVTLLEPPGVAAVRRSQAVRVEHDPALGRYDAYVDDRIAGRLAYRRADQVVLVTRTEVRAERDEHGVADALVRRAVEDARGKSQVVPLCDYVRWWLGQHPEFAPVVFDPAVD